MSSRPTIAGVALSLAAAVAGACASPPRDARPAGTSVAVQITPVELVEWPNRFEAGGVFTARNTAVISSRIVAPITGVLVRPGDVVRRGQPLVELDTAELRARAAQATSTVEAARQAATAATADARSADAALVMAQASHRRVSTLQARRSATAQELDQAVADLAMAEARAAATAARVAAAASAIETAESAAEAAAIATAYGVLMAPFDGTVVERSADPGTMAAPGSPLLVLEDRSALQLDVRLDATRAAATRLNDTVQVHVDAAGQDASPWIDARIVEIARINPAAHSFSATIALPATPAWRSGLAGRARFRDDSRRALTVPASAVIRRGQLAFVFVVAKDGIARLRAVSIGDVEDTRVEILDGIVAAESVVTTPPPGLEDGARVTVERRP